MLIVILVASVVLILAFLLILKPMFYSMNKFLIYFRKLIAMIFFEEFMKLIGISRVRLGLRELLPEPLVLMLQ
jgi:hypothetical protein